MMKDRFESLESGEVVSIQHDKQVLIGHSTFRVGELNDAIKKQLESTIDGWSEDKSAWFDPKGIDCEALRFGSAGWQKGRIRLCLEFCPDEVSPATESTLGQPIPMTASGSPLPAPITTMSEHSAHASLQAIATPVTPEHAAAPTTNVVSAVAAAPTVERETSESAGLPLAGFVAVGTMAAGAAVAAATTHPADEAVALEDPILPQPEATTTHPVDEADTSEDLTLPQLEVASSSMPHAEAVLMLEDDLHQPSDLHSAEMDEIAFDFDRAHSDGQGKVVPDGLMDLDLTDLDLDRAEQDYLNFETAGMPDIDRELANLQDLGRAENSGVLDEVWQEISQQPNWPGIH
jgi:KGK domain